ncbi:putative secreted protein (Por secretion system target) [Jejuia pallidilutea]|uniref:Putative secreted protein (Por secretion system target) n=1 Tax=Jejuia pallidilutea TaxID=504487 RepID=A0A362X0X9_9FLAO|nr:T9SS type A sorting domain-containing protein [Jejuia pallidilutea]PQV48389.1 putative secreted protein (Por secretion system target) [Jejuia pallidilutea]
MKKITFLLAVLTLSISYGQNLLSGGGFEGLTTGKITSASTPWSSGIGNATFQPSINSNSANAHTGDQFLNMGNDFSNFRQNITAVPGTQYTVTFWNLFVSGQGQPASTDGIFVSVRDNSGGNGTQFDPIISFYVDPSTVDANWNQFTFDFVAPQADLLFFVAKQSRAAGGPNNSARMDDFSIVETPTASVADLQKFNFKSYPNPANNFIKLSASKNIDKVEIYSLLGKQVFNKTLASKSNEINVSNLANGVYVVKAYIEDAVGTYKFIKQ